MAILRRDFIAASVACLLLATGCGQSAEPSAEVATPTPETTVRYEFIRNATARLHYADKVILLDPMLSDVGAFQSFAGIAPNPTVPLTRPAETIIEGIDFTVVSHMHSDHFDDAAAELLPKDMLILTPDNDFGSGGDERTLFKPDLESRGFTNVKSPKGESLTIEGITMHQTWALHGRGAVGEIIGEVNGIVFEAEGEPTIYWAGDTIWDADEMQPILERFEADIVIAHTGGPIIEAISPEILLMDAEEGVQFFEQASAVNPNVKMIAVHMESLDHCFSTRTDLRKRVSELDTADQARIFIPEDGETLTF